MNGATFLQTTVRASAALSILACVAAGCELEPLPIPEICSIEGKNARIYDLMKDSYLWYREVPDVDPAAYASPEELLDVLKYKELDRWSYIADAEIYYAHYAGWNMGFGYRWKYDRDGKVKFSYIEPGSPADEKGLKRGDAVVAVAGKSIDEIEEKNLWIDVLGEDEEGVRVTFTVESTGDATIDIDLEKTWHPVNTTPIVKTLDVGSRRVGYLLFNAFLDISEADLPNAFAELKAAQVEDLILDLRYNSGGYLHIAALLASLVRPASMPLEPFERLEFNDKHTEDNETVYYGWLEQSLGLPRVFIITTQDTASASEAVINGLRPYTDVKLIGYTTHGKPVGMRSLDYCDIMVVPITFQGVNADGFGDYYDGFEPDCFADDLMAAELGSETEASIAEAIHLLETGSCSEAPQASPEGGAKVTSWAPGKQIPRPGFRGETGLL